MYRLRALFGGERRRSCPGRIFGPYMEGQWNKKKKKRRGGAGVRRSLFDLFSLVFLDFFCFVVFLLVSCFFSLSSYFGLSRLSVTIWRNA